jgi:hypothetical protein
LPRAACRFAEAEQSLAELIGRERLDKLLGRE